jgi:hypothetical protein
MAASRSSVADGTTANVDAPVRLSLKTNFRQSPVYAVADADYGGPRSVGGSAVSKHGWEGEIQSPFAAGATPVARGHTGCARGGAWHRPRTPRSARDTEGGGA